MYSSPKGLGKMGNKANKGFTLVELIAVVAIISMIAVYITIEINRSSDDAKIGIATAFLTSNVPSAISSFRARNLGSCKGIEEAAADNENLPDLPDGDGGGADGVAKQRLMVRGLAAETPWDDFWGVDWDLDQRTITIDFPIPGANADAISDDLLSNLDGKSQIVSAEAAQGGITIVYSCS